MIRVSPGDARHGYDDAVRIPSELQSAFVRAYTALTDRAPGLPPLLRDRLALVQARFGADALVRVTEKTSRDRRNLLTRTGVSRDQMTLAGQRARAALAQVPNEDKLGVAERQILLCEFEVQALRFLVSAAARAQAQAQLETLRVAQAWRSFATRRPPTIDWTADPATPGLLPTVVGAGPDLARNRFDESGTPSSPRDKRLYVSPERPPNVPGNDPVLVYTVAPAPPAGMVWLYHRCANGHHYNAAARHDPMGDVIYDDPRYAWCTCGATTYVTLPGRPRYAEWRPRLRVSCPSCGVLWYPITLRQPSPARRRDAEWTNGVSVTALGARCGDCARGAPGRPPSASITFTLTNAPPPTVLPTSTTLTTLPTPTVPPTPTSAINWSTEYLDAPFPADGEE